MTFPIIFYITVCILALLVLVGFLYANKVVSIPLKTLAALACPTCGAVYGLSLAKSAKQNHLDQLKSAQKAHPHCKLNPARHWVVICPQCKTTMLYKFECNDLIPPAA